MRIGYKLQTTATPGFHSLYDWCFQTLGLFSAVPDDPGDKTVMEKHSAEALCSAVTSLIHAIWTEDHDAQQDEAKRTIQIAMFWTIRRWSELQLAHWKPLVQIPKTNAHFPYLKCTEEEHAERETLVETYTLQRASGVWRVLRWRLACFSLVLGDTEDRNDISG